MRNTSILLKSTLPNNITWKQINWIHVNRYVEKLQQRIYRAESLGDKKTKTIKIKSMLELYVVKATRTVLRRERGGNLSDLADVGQVRFRRGAWAVTPLFTQAYVGGTP